MPPKKKEIGKSKESAAASSAEDFEKLGVFYLGRAYDAAKSTLTDDAILYDSRDLTTHAVCVGMTGSGKTGLCVSLLEEAAIDGIPALCIRGRRAATLSAATRGLRGAL